MSVYPVREREVVMGVLLLTLRSLPPSEITRDAPLVKDLHG